MRSLLKFSELAVKGSRNKFYLNKVSMARSIHSSTGVFSIENDFKNAKEQLSKLGNDPGNDVKLQIYGLFKQATEGKNTKPKPGMMDFVGKAKWEAWNSLGNMSKEEAMKGYVNLVNSLAATSAPAAASAEPSPDVPCEGILVKREHGGSVLTIQLNRPEKKNALTFEMYGAWAKLLSDAGKDDRVKMVVVTGTGDYFCSGNDLSNFTQAAGNPKEMAKQGHERLKTFVAAFIDFPKPLVALVNGPAVGISVSTLALYDAVVTADHATFHLPFSALGQTPEACSSYTFPKMMGLVKANSLVMFNRKIGAQEAYDLGLVSYIVKRDSFQQETERLVTEWSQLPPQTLGYSKGLIRARERALLHEVNAAECARLEERWTSDECMNAIMRFFGRKGSAKL